MRRFFALALAVVAGVVVLEACSRDSVRAGEARLDPDGVVLVAEGAKPYKRVKDTRTIRDGDRVKVESGSAGLKLPTGDLALRSGSELRLATAPELLAGDVLVLPAKSISVNSNGTEAVVVGAGRVTRDFTVTAASYDGAVVMRSGGATLNVPRFRQATVPAPGQLPRTPSPLQFRDGDAWDRRFLAEAIDLSAELDARSNGATARFRNQGRTAGFYRTLFPDLEDEQQFDETLLDAGRAPGEHIVGAGIALATNPGGQFAERWRQIFEFRGQGAAWGLVAMDQAVSRVPGLVGSIDQALGRVPLSGNGTRTASAPIRPGPSTPTTSTTSTTQTTRTTTRPTPPTTPTTEPEPIVPIPDPPDTGLPIDEPGDDVVDILDGLLPKNPQP